jgi:hypothetical protein
MHGVQVFRLIVDAKIATLSPLGVFGRVHAHVVSAECRCGMQAVATRFLLTLDLALLCNVAYSA